MKSDTNQNNVSVLINPFYLSLDTAIILTNLAIEANNTECEQALSKSSIVHCALVIEALANSLISNIGFQDKFVQSVDKLETIAKLELFNIIWNHNPKLHRGKNCIQIFQEFISLRNTYVHPKVYERSAEKHNDGYAILVKGKWPMLKLTKDSNLWFSENAKSSLNLLLHALDDFIMDVLELCNKKVEDIILFTVHKDSKNELVPPKGNYPWNNPYLEKFYYPRFLKRLKSHEQFCNKTDRNKRKPC